MTQDEARQAMVGYWLEQADEALAVADIARALGRTRSAINRAYYAAFYAASAVLLNDGKTFERHSGVQRAFHQHMVHTGKVRGELGPLYDRLFALRLKVDYVAFTEVSAEEVGTLIEGARELVAVVRRLTAAGAG